MYLYRCGFACPLVDENFKSKAALGEVLRVPETAKQKRLFEGVSVYSDLRIAQTQAKRFNPPAKYLVELHIPDAGSIPCESTGSHTSPFGLLLDGFA